MKEKVKKRVSTKNTVHYINNKQFTQEILRCKYGLLNEETGYQHKKGELSPKAVEFFMILVNRAILKLKFSNPLDKEDLIQSALFDLVKYWQNFDETRSNNAFSYFTQIAKNGYAKEYKRIHHKTGVDKTERIEIISLSHGGESEIYSI